MPNEAATIFVVDDDASVREALKSLLRSAGYAVEVFASADEFMRQPRVQSPACLVLDVRMPGRNGLDFQRDLAAAGVELPIIFITGHGDIPMSVRAIKAGAVEFLTKPFRDEDLLSAIELGLKKDRERRRETDALAALRGRFNTLSAREREVMAQVVTGRLNKQIAADLGLSEITIKVHRGQVMRKMEAGSVADLVRMADRLEAGRRLQAR